MAAPSQPPENIQAAVLESTSITFQWTEIPCSGRRGQITGYSYELLKSSNQQVVASGLEQSTSITITGLIPNTRYTFSVSGETSGGIGVFSDDYSVTTDIEGKI